MHYRDDKGRFVKRSADDNKHEDNTVYGFYSKLLNKPFDTLEDLRAAEAAEREAREAAEAKAATKRNEAAAVYKAINAYEEGRAVCDAAIAEAYKKYRAAVEAAEKDLDKLHADADKALDTWVATHPGENFRYTYKSPDGKSTREYKFYNERFDVMDAFEAFKQAISTLY